jgi:hypothetical protein
VAGRELPLDIRVRKSGSCGGPVSVLLIKVVPTEPCFASSVGCEVARTREGGSPRTTLPLSRLIFGSQAGGCRFDVRLLTANICRKSAFSFEPVVSIHRTGLILKKLRPTAVTFGRSSVGGPENSQPSGSLFFENERCCDPGLPYGATVERIGSCGQLLLKSGSAKTALLHGWSPEVFLSCHFPQVSGLPSHPAQPNVWTLWPAEHSDRPVLIVELWPCDGAGRGGTSIEGNTPLH